MILLLARLTARCLTFVLILYWSAAFLGTHLPASAVSTGGVPDKWLHFLAYAGLALLLACTVASYRRITWGTYLWMAAVLLVYGAIDESSQVLVPGRHADFHDWLANAGGIVVGLMLHRFALTVCESLGVCRLQPKRIHQSST